MKHPVDHSLLIFDVDGTLRRCTVERQPCPNTPGEWELLPRVVETLAQYDWTKIAISFCSNQAGVSLGYLTELAAYALIVDCVFQAIGLHPQEDMIHICPHALDAGCRCRKPEPGMLLAAYNIAGQRGLVDSPTECAMIGDMPSDREAAQNAGMHFIAAYDFFGWSKDAASARREEGVRK